MGDGTNEVNPDGVAEPGHEADDLEDEIPVRKDDEPDGDGQSRKGSDERKIEQTREESIDDQTEYHDVSENSHPDIVLTRSVSWSGALPMPKDFNGYPDKVQDKIVEWADRNLAINEKVIAASVVIDQQNSDRMNDYTKAEINQTNRAVTWTGVLNLMLVVGAIVVGVVTNNPVSVATIIGGLASINIIPALTKNQSSRRSSSSDGDVPDKTKEIKRNK